MIAAAVALARDLINTPSDIKTPGWLADQAAAVAGRPASACGSGTRRSWPGTDSAASSPSGPVRRTRHG